MHPKNPHIEGYDFDHLVSIMPNLEAHVVVNPKGRKTIDFSNSESVKCLNQALLKAYYGVAFWDIPQGCLCPPVPGRADYVLALNEYLDSHAPTDVGRRVLDLGTGANIIYPIIGSALCHWHCVGSDIDELSVANAQAILKSNGALSKRVRVVKQTNRKRYFQGVIQKDDWFDAVMCNPPFHSSAEDALQGSERKRNNLKRQVQKRHSKVVHKDDRLNFSGRGNELWCEGGELAFVGAMIKESRLFAEQVGIFTSLISQKEHVAPLIKQVKAAKAAYDIVDMAQGQKQSRFLVWYFNKVSA